MPHLLIGNPNIAAEYTRFDFGVADRATATQLYDALYEETQTPGVMVRRQNAFPPGALNYSPFVANYVKPATTDGARNFIWPAARPGVATPPTTDAALAQARKDVNDTVVPFSINVHQRGFALTSGDSIKYFLNTQSMSPCITMIVWSPATRTAALAHVDKLQDFKATVDNLLDRVSGTVADPVRVHFHGGNCKDKILAVDPYTGAANANPGSFVSWNTATALLQAILQRNDTDRICISSFDVLARPHGDYVAFDTRDGRVLPEIGDATGYALDSPYRLFTVRAAFQQRFPEGFHAENPNRDVIAQTEEFNRTIGGDVGNPAIVNNDIPIDPTYMCLPRLETDLRTIDSGIAPQAPQPVIRFLNQTKNDLFTWATNRVFSLAAGGSRMFYQYSDVKAIIMIAGGVQPVIPDITRMDQVLGLYKVLAKFESIVREPAPAAAAPGAGPFVGYLDTLARAMKEEKTVEGLSSVSATWTKTYGFA